MYSRVIVISKTAQAVQWFLAAYCLHCIIYIQHSQEESFIIYCDENAEAKYLSLTELGLVLHELSNLPSTFKMVLLKLPY